MYLSKLGFFKKKLVQENMNLRAHLNLLLTNLKNHTLRKMLLAYIQQEIQRQKLAASSTKKMLLKLKYTQKKRRVKRKLLIKVRQEIVPKIPMKKIKPQAILSPPKTSPRL